MNEFKDSSSNIPSDEVETPTESPNKPWPDTLTLSGRVLDFFTNIKRPDSYTGEPASATEDPTWNNDLETTYQIYTYLSEKGIVEIPEQEATSAHGHVLPDYVAVYVDTRIGDKQVGDFVFPQGWLGNHDDRLATYPRQPIPVEEIRELIDEGLKETGLGALAAKKAQEDEERAGAEREVPVPDLNELMRTMRDQLK
jgi:hypothetical protein